MRVIRDKEHVRVIHFVIFSNNPVRMYDKYKLL